MPRSPKARAKARSPPPPRMADGSHTPESRAKALGPRHAQYFKRCQNTPIAIQPDGRMVIAPHPLSQTLTIQPPTPPDSSDDENANSNQHVTSQQDLLCVCEGITSSRVSTADSEGTAVGEAGPSQAMPQHPPAANTSSSEGSICPTSEPMTPESPVFDLHPLHEEEILPRTNASPSTAIDENTVNSSDDSSDEDNEISVWPDPSRAVLLQPSEPDLSWAKHCDWIDFDAPEPVEEDDIDVDVLRSTERGRDYLRFLNPPPAHPSYQKPLYAPTPRWRHAEGMDFEDVEVIQTLREGAFGRGYIKKGTLCGERITFISKEWNLNLNSEGFFSELALFMSPKYLRDLQGDCIPQLIGVYKHRDLVSIAFELPHCSSWMEAHSGLDKEIKQSIVQAYQKIHDKGVLHNDIGLRHILIGDDKRVTIIDFNIARALVPMEDVGLTKCDKADLERELREVTVKLRCEGAIAAELQLINAAKLCSSDVGGSSCSRKRKASSLEEDMEVTRRRGPKLDERLSQTEDELCAWILKKDVPSRMVVPGMASDNTLPLPVLDFEEDEIVTEFLEQRRDHPPEVESCAPILTDLPRRLLRVVGSYISALFFSHKVPVILRDSHSPGRPVKRRKV